MYDFKVCLSDGSAAHVEASYVSVESGIAYLYEVGKGETVGNIVGVFTNYDCVVRGGEVEGGKYSDSDTSQAPQASKTKEEHFLEAVRGFGSPVEAFAAAVAESYDLDDKDGFVSEMKWIDEGFKGGETTKLEQSKNEIKEDLPLEGIGGLGVLSIYRIQDNGSICGGWSARIVTPEVGLTCRVVCDGVYKGVYEVIDMDEGRIIVSSDFGGIVIGRDDKAVFLSADNL